jgi:hypothetical protein
VQLSLSLPYLTKLTLSNCFFKEKQDWVDDEDKTAEKNRYFVEKRVFEIDDEWSREGTYSLSGNVTDFEESSREGMSSRASNK